MKRVISLALTLLLLITGCGQSLADQWQEQYDLGVRYLSEGNYEEAILAFTAAIEINPNRAEAYVGRGDAYVASGETEANLAAAQADYERAIELDPTIPEAWLGLADVYIRWGDYDQALEVLREALERTGNNQAIADMIAQIESKETIDIREQFQEMLQQEGVVTYEDLPVFFEVNYDDVGALLGLERERAHERKQTGQYTWNNETIEYDISIQECIFEGDGSGIYQVRTHAPIGSSRLLEMEVHTDLELAETGAIGWREIYLGDSFATVLQKLGLHDIPEDYKCVDIYLFDGEAEPRGDIQESSGVSYSGVPTPMINVLFFNEGETAPAQSVVFEFHDGIGDFLNRVIYHNIELLHSLAS